jgi:kynureninase
MVKSNDPLLQWRNEFPILENITYLISNSLGAMPRSVYESLNEYAKTWAEKGVRAWEDEWWEMSLSVGNLMASLIGAGQNEVTMHVNVSLLQSMLISSFEYNLKRNKIVLTNLEFPSNIYVYKKLAAALGADIQVIKSKDGIIPPTNELIDSIDYRTLLVLVSHVLFKSAYIMELKEIIGKAHLVGATVIIDAYHSVGTVPVDVKELEADILVGGVLKWLCGGPGGAFLWVNSEILKKLQPKVTGWLAHKNPFNFEEEMTYTDSPYKFLNGTPSIPSLYAAKEGPKIITEVGIEKIRDKSTRQTSMIIKEAKKAGYKINTPLKDERRGGTVTLDMPNSYEISKELLSNNIMIDYRKSAGIRFAPHFYNSDEEILKAMDILKTIIETKSYEKHFESK